MQKIHDRPGGGSIDRHLIDFKADVPKLEKTQFAC